MLQLLFNIFFDPFLDFSIFGYSFKSFPLDFPIFLEKSKMITLNSFQIFAPLNSQNLLEVDFLIFVELTFL